VPPEELGWRSVTFEIEPLADRTQIARDSCWENERIFIATSWCNKAEKRWNIRI